MLVCAGVCGCVCVRACVHVLRIVYGQDFALYKYLNYYFIIKSQQNSNSATSHKQQARQLTSGHLLTDRQASANQQHHVKYMQLSCKASRVHNATSH